MQKLTAVLAIIQQNNKILLTKRVEDEGGKYHGHWQTPGGGIEPGENAEQAVIREMIEELGLTVKIINKHTKIVTVSDEFREISFDSFYCELPIGSTIILNEEASEYKWFMIEEALKMDLTPASRILLTQL